VRRGSTAFSSDNLGRIDLNTELNLPEKALLAYKNKTRILKSIKY